MLIVQDHQITGTGTYLLLWNSICLRKAWLTSRHQSGSKQIQGTKKPKNDLSSENLHGTAPEITETVPCSPFLLGGPPVVVVTFGGGCSGSCLENVALVSHSCLEPKPCKLKMGCAFTVRFDVQA